ncbi:MAG: FAD-dependent oxidoreductase, partial [Verrucomicrobiales bacterium]
SVERDRVWLEGGDSITADQVVIATDASSAARLLPGLPDLDVTWRATTALYFSAQTSPISQGLIALNGGGAGLVNHVCSPSDIAPSYAPAGQSLICVSLLGEPGQANLEDRVRSELEGWFGDEVNHWRWLRTDRICQALPEQLPSRSQPALVREHSGIHICGDHLASRSIEGAITSGIRTAEAVCATQAG